MTKKEYLKYNNPEAFDVQGRPIKPGDTVVINCNYFSTPRIGVVQHFTATGRLAILYDFRNFVNATKMWAYREPRKVVKIKNGHKNTNKNNIKSKS